MLYCRKPGNVWSSKVFFLNHIDYVSLNSNPWDGNAPSLGNSWEPRKSKMAAVILIDYKMCLSLHYIMLGTNLLYVHACFEVRGIQWNRL